MGEYGLCWPEDGSALARQGLLLLVEVQAGGGLPERGVPCRVVGTIAPGTPPFPGRQGSPSAAEDSVNGLLAEVGVPLNLLGYGYLRTALLLVTAHPEMRRGLSRLLYPQVAQEHCVTPRSVERAIRHAIGQTWARGGGERCRRLMGRYASCIGDRPTNSEFISLLADRLTSP